MKKQIAIAMGLAVLSTGALASKARLEALGQGAGGSQFIDDARNVILNPAMLNFHKDFVTMEWGDTSAQTDSTATPRAEGGMFKASGNMIYGLYFGEESNTSNALRAASGVTVNERNNTTFYIAGDAGVQWGAKLLYHSYENEQGTNDQKSDAMRSTIGIISGDVEAYLNIGLGNTAEDGSNEFKGGSSFDLGVTYGMGDMDYLLNVSTIAGEQEDGEEFKAQYIRVGAAKAYKLNDKANVWTSAWYAMDNSECDLGACANTGRGSGEQKDAYLPVSIALEVAAKDWLTFRGSVTSNVIGTSEDDNGDKATIDNSTVVAAGATLSWGDLSFDGMVGNNTSTGVGGSAAAGSDTADGNGTLRTDTLMSRVSMTYKF